MSAPVFLRNQFSDLYGADMLPALEELYRFELSLHPSRRELLFNDKPVSNGIFQSSEIHDMALHAAISEGEDYSYTRPRQGASKTLTTVKYGLGASISEESIKDGKFDVVSMIIKKMAKSAREAQEIQAMNVINNGFSTETTADGVAIFSTAHTLPSGGTWRNRLSSDADLSRSALDTMLTDFGKQQVGDSGIIANIQPKVLLVPWESKRYAMELVGSELQPDSADNNMNSLKGEGLQVVASPHLTDTDSWFLLGEKSETGLVIVKSSGIETKSEEEFDNDSIKFKSRYREKVGCTHPYALFGTSGGA
jgi:hypothetical protein